MARISPDHVAVTPAEQQRLANLLAEGIRQTIETLPRFVSATILTSLDGTGVVNVAR